MIDQQLLNVVSQYALTIGLRVLHCVRFSDDDVAHIAMLLNAMMPDDGGHWLDIGCGFGEPARLMSHLRPDLDFTLINNNQFQLDHAPETFARHWADMRELPFSDGMFDGAMFLFSLCHEPDKEIVLEEAARVVRPGGELFVFDYERLDGDDARTAELLHSWFPYHTDLCIAALGAGWTTLNFEYPAGDDSLFRKLFDNDDVYHELIDPLQPYLMRARRL